MYPFNTYKQYKHQDTYSSPQSNSYKINRDEVIFPIIGSESYTIYDGNNTFVDRQQINTRNKNNTPVQNSYMQQYQLNQIQSNNQGYIRFEQDKINNIMNKEPLYNQQHLDRNIQDSQLFKSQQLSFYDIPKNTRKNKFNLDNIRDPIPKNIPQPTNTF